MNGKLTHILVFCFAVLACLPIFNCEHQGPGPLTGGTLQPFASGPQYDPTEPESRRILTIPERIEGTSSAPQGGAGLQWTWSF